MADLLGSPIDIKINSLQKLITIENDKIKLVNQISTNKKPIKICSFLGNARTGKSTLMNCFVSNLLDKNTKVFNTSSKLKVHCTTGIDMLQIEMTDYDLILLDVQGLELQDSQDDCKLLLFVYLISNLIIFNPKTILDNSVLSSLQSLTSIITYVENIASDNKPLLLFRPRDINEDAEFDPEDNLNDMLSTKSKDQFSNVRESIKRLFDHVGSKPTYSLDKKDLRLLSDDKFIEFSKDKSNGFVEFSNYLGLVIDKIKYHDPTSLNLNLKQIIKNINSNTKINFAIFDITKREAELEIKEWILDTIDKSQYDTLIEGDGTQENYNQIIQPRINYRNMILEKFDERFSKTTPKIKEIKRKEITDTFSSHINLAIKNSLDIANVELNIISNTKIKTYTITIANTNFKINELDPIAEELINYYKNTVWLDKVKERFISELNKKIFNLKKDTEQLMDKQIALYNEYIEEQIEFIRIFINENNPLCDKNIKDFYVSFDYIIERITDHFCTCIIDKLSYSKFNIVINNFRVRIITNNSMIPSDDILEHIKDTGELVDYESDEDQLYTTIVGDYYRESNGSRFIEERAKLLPDFLNEIQQSKIVCSSDWVSVKKLYVDNKSLLYRLKAGSNEVKFLNILESIINISTELTPFELNIIASKYAFIVNKLNIHKIYSTSEYLKIYDKIIIDYQQQIILTESKYLKYIITMKIIDMLFDKALII